MNKQDIEDFKQDFEVKLLLGVYQPINKKTLQDFYVRSETVSKQVKQLRRNRLIAGYKEFCEFSASNPQNDEEIFEMLSHVNFLPSGQYAVISKFLQLGSVKAVSAELGKNHETTKAVFRQAVLNLRKYLCQK